MALLQTNFFAESLGLSTTMTVILPQPTSHQIGMASAARTAGHPVLYLLHGLSDDDTIWLRRTAIERYVAALGLAVVMPQVSRSFYTDEAHGNRYWTFLSEELPALVSDFFNVSTRREDTFVAGLSMGGYGALKWALRQPERFAAAASLSGALDVAAMRGRGGRSEVLDLVFGAGEVSGTENDLLHLIHTADATRLPSLYLACGTEDHLVQDNRTFVAACTENGVELTTDFGPGQHRWDYWDEKIQQVLAWLEAQSPAAFPTSG